MADDSSELPSEQSPETTTPKPPESVRATTVPALQRAIAGMAFQFSHGPAPDKFLEKMEPQHITKVLDYTEAENVREDSRKKHFFWGSLIIGVIGFLALCWMFLHFQQTPLLEKILILFIGLIGGGAAGYGFGKRSKDA